MTAPRFKGAPFNLRTIRWHKARRGFEWQYWNHRVGRWCRHTRRPWPTDQARAEIAQWVYGCDPSDVVIEMAP